MNTIISVLTGRKTTIFLAGKWFDFVTGNGLYLSSNKAEIIPTRYDFYTEVKSLSSWNKPFSGYKVDEYTKYSDNSISFVLSAFYTPQNIDIIFCNPAGYTLASDSKRFSHVQIVSSLS